MTERVLINGELVSQVSIFDRGLQYGDGLFETMAVRDGRIPLWPHHWRRLQTDCARLRIPPPDENTLQGEIAGLIGNETEAVLKLIVTRGRGERGYAMPIPGLPTRILALSPMPYYPVEYRQDGICLYRCETRLGINPLLAGIKHLNRLEQVMARSEWQDKECQEGLMLDINGHVIEGIMSNIFWVKNRALFTPDLSGSGVAGVMRGIVLQLAQKKGITVQTGLWPTKDLFDAEEIFITNSLIGIWPVRYILNKTFQAGPVTLQLQAMLQADYAI